MKIVMTMAAAAVALTTLPAAAQMMAPADYVAKAGASDLFEINSSRTVLETTQNPAVRKFADQMIRHHMKSTADVKAAAARSRLRPAAPQLEPMQQTMIDELRAATGTQRDTVYVTQQRAAHEKALALHQSYAADGSAPALKAAAAKIVPVVQMHIEMLKTM